MPARRLQEPEHFAALDGLRGLAILLVIPHNGDIFSNGAAWLLPVAWLAHAGWIGVQLFFVLSGFLITRNLLQARGADNYFSAFFGRRALRILPLYYLTLFVALIVVPQFIDLPASTLASYRHQIWLWTFLSNWTQPLGADVSGFSHFWSLAIEEQFYLLWPLAVLALAERQLLKTCVAIAVIALICRVALLAHGAPPLMAYTFTVCRMDALAAGAAVAVMSHSPTICDWMRQRHRLVWGTSVTAILVLAAGSHLLAAHDTVTLTIGHSILALAFAAIMFAVIAPPIGTQPRANRILSAAWLRSVGRYSYAMYVFHLPLLNIFGSSIRKEFAFTGPLLPLVYALTAILMSYAAGFVSYHLLEKHFLKLKSLFALRPHVALSRQA